MRRFDGFAQNFGVSDPLPPLLLMLRPIGLALRGGAALPLRRGRMIVPLLRGTGAPKGEPDRAKHQ
jgi:hypothetical protein